MDTRSTLSLVKVSLASLCEKLSKTRNPKVSEETWETLSTQTVPLNTMTFYAGHDELDDSEMMAVCTPEHLLELYFKYEDDGISSSRFR